jgi:hypothetical protein
MANSFQPNGFSVVRRLDGAAWTGNMDTRLIAKANTHKFYQGDPVVVLSTGYIDAVAPGSAPTQGVLGIFMGCESSALSSGSPWSNTYQGGATSTVDLNAYVITDPLVVMRVWVGTGSSSAAGGPAILSSVQQNINYYLGTGNSSSGISGAYVDFNTLATTNTLPFTIIGLVQGPPGVNGTDITTAGNIVEVTFNQQAYRVGTTGI